MIFNLYEQSQQTTCRQPECEGILFVEYQCPPGKELQDIWSQHGYIAFVRSGKKIWITLEGEYPACPGDALYCKKGAHLVHNYYEEDFCALFFSFLKNSSAKLFWNTSKALKKIALPPPHFQVLSMQVDISLKAFFESVMSYFFQDAKPSGHLLKLKFKELILQVLTTHHNPELASYFLSLAHENTTNLKQVMQDNFLYNLSLEDYARICNRSLSSFKRDFKDTFGVSPGRWLIEQRLKYAKMRLLTTKENINDIAFHSGSETTSHFIRCFNKHFGLPPHQFRQQALAEVN